MLAFVSPIELALIEPAGSDRVPVALRLVNEPEFGVVDPIAPGAAHVEPSKLLALIVPVPLKFSVAPLLTFIAAVVLMPLVIAEKEDDAEAGAHCAPPEVYFKTSPLLGAALETGIP